MSDEEVTEAAVAVEEADAVEAEGVEVVDVAEAVDAGEVVDVAEVVDAGEVVDVAEVVDAGEVVDVAEVVDAGEADASGEAEGDDEGAETPSKRGAALENEGEIAADYLEELLDIADLDGDIDTFVEGGRAHVSILTAGDLLVGRDGEVLEALQELARLAVMTETGHRSRLMLDVAGHRDKRRKVLQDLAADAVAAVTENGDPVRLAPMNPFERKIVHDVVAAAGLVSESEGEEPQRRVVVLPKA